MVDFFIFLFNFFFRGNHSGGEKLEAAFDNSKLQISHISVFLKQGGDADKTGTFKTGNTEYED